MIQNYLRCNYDSQSYNPDLIIVIIITTRSLSLYKIYMIFQTVVVIYKSIVINHNCLKYNYDFQSFTMAIKIRKGTILNPKRSYHGYHDSKKGHSESKRVIVTSKLLLKILKRSKYTTHNLF